MRSPASVCNLTGWWVEIEAISAAGRTALDALAAYEGDPAAPDPFSVITVNTDAPNPVAVGIGSTDPANWITVNVLEGAGLDVAGFDAIRLLNDSTVTNDGTIAATTNAFSGIVAIDRNTITNNGDVTSQGNAIFLQDDNTVIHTGTATSTLYSGIVVLNGNTLSVGGSATGKDTGLYLGNENTLTSTANLERNGNSIYATWGCRMSLAPNAIRCSRIHSCSQRKQLIGKG